MSSPVHICPCFGKRIIFCTNYFASDPRKRNFDLALINVDGTGLEEGQSVPLGSHAMIVADSTHFEFTTEKPAADGDGDGFGDGYGTN